VTRAPLQTRLISIVEPVLEAAGYELVDLRFTLEQGGWTLRVAVDLPIDPSIDPADVPSDRVDLSDCEDISRELSAVLDVEDPIPQAFSLEVSSPGIDRPLRTVKHYAYYAGSEAKIQLAMAMQLPTGERRNFKGILGGVEDGKVVIECDGAVYRLALDDIEQAKLVPDWDAVMKGKSGAGRQGPKPVKPGHRPSQKSTMRHSRSEQARPEQGRPDQGDQSQPQHRGSAAGDAANDAENKEQG
jgi:ribosome maturation factor RimP